MSKDQFTLHETISVSMQLRTLHRLRSAVAAAANAGIKPVIEIDLDLCALRPVTRTAAALGVVGSEFSIGEFRDPAKLQTLPGYSDEAWLRFIQDLDLPRRYPGWPWISQGRAVRPPGSPFARFHELYWNTNLLSEDEPTSGLGLFVEDVEAAGGCVVFLSGRWLNEQVEPTLASLRRAGIPEPKLVIGNPFHETIVSEKSRALSDSMLKAWRQQEIRRRWGTPVAIIDDRESNRTAILSANENPVLSVGIAIPGFTVDPAITQASLKLSTFDDFTQTIDSRPVRRHLRLRYPGLGFGKSWNGLYSGLGRNGLPYHLPRFEIESNSPDLSETPFRELLKAHQNLALTEEAFLTLAEETIPDAERREMRFAIAEARRLADIGLACPWPPDSNAGQRLWFGLVCAWLHSRDIDVMMHALGYPIRATGIHDLREWIAPTAIRALIIPDSPTENLRISRSQYSPWIRRWADQLDDGDVNIGFLNPSLLVSLCEWSPSQVGPQDAMDVHRLSDHHEGDGDERFDPIEAGINNLLHQREGSYGVRKESIATWEMLSDSVRSESGATELAKNSAARQAVRDACDLGMKLEFQGKLTPWYLCMPLSERVVR